RVGGGTVPVLLAGRKPHDVTSPHFLDRTGFALNAAETRGDDQRLTKRMRVPCRAGAGLEGDVAATDTRRFGRLKQRIDAHLPGEPFGRALARRLRTASFDVHGR